MKHLNFWIYFIITFSFLSIEEIIPQCNGDDCLGYYEENSSTAIIAHNHYTNGGNCIGYAIAETQQSYLGSVCGLSNQVYINEAEAKKYWMSWGFYDKYSFPGYVQPNDILIWDLYEDELSMKLNHAAIVHSYSTSYSYIIIRFINANYGDNARIHYDTLRSSNGYKEPGGYGRPNYIVRRNTSKKTYGYAITLKTSFNAGTLKVDGISYSIPGSEGVLVKNLSRGAHTLYADDRQYNGSAWVGYKEWLDNNNQPIVSDPTRTATINLDKTNGFGGIYLARYVNFYNVTIQNNFVGITYNGNVKVNDTFYSAPKTTEVREGEFIKFEIPNDEQNGIKYQFDHWQDNNTQNPRTITNILGNMSLTAYYRGKPSTANRLLTTGTVVGEPIVLYWNEHPNTYVTKYQIWRKVKYNGVMESDILLATKNRGTLSYIDYGYALTSGYTNELLFYDVRPYYSIENTYSDPYWKPVYGKILPKSQDSLISLNRDFENSLSNFPNPFNPTTTITYSIQEPGLVTIKVFDLIGQEVAELVNEEKEVGSYSINFNASTLPNV